MKRTNQTNVFKRGVFSKILKRNASNKTTSKKKNVLNVTPQKKEPDQWSMSSQEALHASTLRNNLTNKTLNDEIITIKQRALLVSPHQEYILSENELNEIINDINALEKNNSTSKKKDKLIPSKKLAAQPTKQKKTNGCVMVVDGSTTIRKLLYKLLTSFGLTVHTATDAYDALTQLKNTKPDLIITDLALPKMSGTSLMKKIKNNVLFLHTPIIIMTQSPSDHCIEMLTSFGAANVISKPFSKKQIHDAISMFRTIPELSYGQKQNLSIGIISDCSQQRQAIRNLLNRKGYNVPIDSDCINLDINLQANTDSVNGWIIGIATDDQLDIIDELEKRSNTPILLGVGTPPKHESHTSRWEHNIMTKLHGMLNHQSTMSAA